MFLALSNALAVWAAYVLADQSRWVSLTILVAVTAAIDLVYLAPHRRTLPLKFLVPGTIFLLAFQIVPIVYTIEVALSNYSTGHIISKADAIQQIKINSLQQPENGKQYEAAPARDKDGHLVLILRDDTSGAVFVGTQEALKPLAKSSVKVDPDTGIPIAAAGYTLIKGAELFSLDKQLSAFDIPTTGDAAIRAQGVHNAVELRRRSATTPRTTGSCGSATASSSKTTARGRSSPRTTRRTSSSRAGRRSPASRTSTS